MQVICAMLILLEPTNVSNVWPRHVVAFEHEENNTIMMASVISSPTKHCFNKLRLIAT
jgi:hypothetical protein